MNAYNILLLSICLIAVAAWTVVLRRPAPAAIALDPPVARYQILNLQLLQPGGKIEPVLFKLDTADGRAWRYEKNTVVQDTRYGTNISFITEGWFELGPWSLAEQEEAMRKLNIDIK